MLAGKSVWDSLKCQFDFIWRFFSWQKLLLSSLDYNVSIFFPFWSIRSFRLRNSETAESQLNTLKCFRHILLSQFFQYEKRAKIVLKSVTSWIIMENTICHLFIQKYVFAFGFYVFCLSATATTTLFWMSLLKFILEILNCSEIVFILSYFPVPLRQSFPIFCCDNMCVLYCAVVYEGHFSAKIVCWLQFIFSLSAASSTV